MDHRDVATFYHKPYEIDEKRSLILLYNEDGDTGIELPIQWEVCATCQGNGKHVNPSIDSNGINIEELDDDFKEDYFSGSYDVPCYECKGKRVVPGSDDGRFSKAVRAAWDDAYSYASEREMGY